MSNHHGDKDRNRSYDDRKHYSAPDFLVLSLTCWAYVYSASKTGSEHLSYKNIVSKSALGDADVSDNPH